MNQRTLGDYNIIKPIGQGTLGIVYLAEHRFMKKQYLLKVLPEELSTDRGFIQRLEEDIAALASLDHPNIVKVYNVTFSQGVYFLVTDCIVDEVGETRNLAQYIMTRGNHLTEDEVYTILMQIALPLDYAHSKMIGKQEIVHRNLKLNNILVGKGKNGPEIYLSDFGLSHIVGSGAILTRTFKNVAEALGIGQQINGLKGAVDKYPSPEIEQQKLTPLHTSFLQNYAFLAPEQKRLDLYPSVDRKVDVYAFGVLAYYLLMHELPEGLFDFPSSRSLSRYDWDRLLLNCLPHEFSRRANELVQLLESIRLPEKIIISFKEEPRIEELPAEEESEIQQQSEVFSVVDFGSTPHPSVGLKPVLHMPQLERPQTDMDPGAVFQINSAVKTYNPEPKDVTNINPILTEMVVINGGYFGRGSLDGNRDEMPRHQVTLSSFAIDIHPVTNEQFVRFLEVMGGEKDSQHNDIIRLRDSRIKRSAGKLSIESGYAKHPVVGVTWYGAITYAKWVGKRLPTEAEWEIASRGAHENMLYPTGGDIEKFQANFFSSDTTAVMSYAPNGLGLYDMGGNVYEWCHDWYGYNYYELSVQEPENPQGPLQGVYRVLRGGCWKSLKEDLRCSRRHRNNPGTVNSTYGFRCAADVQNI